MGLGQEDCVTTWYRRNWQGFGRWRHTRPFWGGLLMVLSGIEYLLSSHLDLSPVKVQFGPQGFLSWVIPLALVLAGVLVWFSPPQRVFYGVLAVAVAVYGLIGLNLGGFLLGMLLGILGGALAASWGNTEPAPAAEPPGDGASGAEERPAMDDKARAAGLTVIVLTLLSLAVAVVGHPGPAAAACPTASAVAPTTKPSLITPPGSSPSAAAAASPTPAVSPSPKASSKPVRGSASRLRTNAQKAAAMVTGCASIQAAAITNPPTVAASPAIETTALLSQTGLSYDGIAALPTATGTIQALKFTMTSASSQPFDMKVPGPSTLDIKSSNLTISGTVILYTTKISGWLFGLIPVTFTPLSPPVLTVPDLFFTAATVDIVFIDASTLTAPSMSMSY